MGRAPNSGAPQRVSAHVVPKAQALAPSVNHQEDEDDKTTIEAGWEEEASTTVEQGDVAEKLRALGLTAEPKRRSNTNITSTGTGTGSSVSDEPTVDDQRGGAALAQLPPTAVARLHITAGNDAGKALEIRPGKTYTVGRGIDNDLVLTDIAVSRKHFDLRHENGAWVLADRGSGNGTVVNARIEDAPFMLATGDVIEIGNTAFRFETPDAPRRAPSVYRTGETTELDDEMEMSTVSGKPYRELLETPPEAPAFRPEPRRMTDEPPRRMPDDLPRHREPLEPPPAMLGAPPMRPKTLPPPAPLPRPRTQTGRPAMSGFDRPLSAQMAIPTAPTQPPMALGSLVPPLMQPAMPISGPLHMPGPSTTMPLPQMANRPPMAGMSALLDPGAPPMPGTLPGQGAPVPPLRARLPFSSNYSSEIPTQRGPSPTRPPMVVQGGMPPRDATSTALVPPTPYGTGQPPIVVPPPFTTLPPMARRTKLAIGGAGLALLAAIATIAVIRESNAPTQASNANAQVGKPTVESIDTKAAIDPKLAHTPPRTKPTVTPITAPVVKPVERVAQQPAANKPPVTAPPPAAHTTPAPTSIAATAPVVDAKPEPRKPAVVEPKPEPKPEPKRVAVKPEPKPEVKKPEPRPARDDKQAKRVANDTVSIVDDPEPPAQKRHSGKSVADIKSEAAALYRNKNFGGAASLISSSLSGFSGEDAQELRSMAAIYSQLGKAYNIGTAPGTKATEAYQALRRAISYDRDVGAAYTSELQDKLASAAARAAMFFMASKEYEQAFQAVRTSESLGDANASSNKAVRERLESVASDLLRSAQGDMQTDPDGGRRKAQQVLGMVDAKNPLYAKAQKLAAGGS